MSKALFFGAAAIGGMAFFTLVSRYAIWHSAAETDMAGSGNNESLPDAEGTCNENMCGPKEGEILKGESELTLSDEQLRKKLTPEQFNVTRRKGTERAFSGAYWNCHSDGVYRCVCCGAPLFSSETKFDSGTGWPSFWKPIDSKAVDEVVDTSHGMRRVGGRVQQVPGPPGPCFRRRAQADPPAVLHQFGFLETRREEGESREDRNRNLRRRLFLGRRGDLPPDQGREGDDRRL